MSFSHLAFEHLATGTLFTDQDDHGIVAVRYLQPGMYEFFDPYITVVTGLLVTEYKPTQRVSIPFQVKANECTYVGRLLLNPNKLEFLWINSKDADLKIVGRELPAGFTSGEVIQPKP